ncbi:HlyD family secretion protein [Providencia vermicola]|uniref:HlyD family secretion protein n=1 Tax=Providencia vermicola TaxID=333965 RepID=UPI001CECAA61|nr:HlyD family secretion protein [Providencia vermicola]
MMKNKKVTISILTIIGITCTLVLSKFAFENIEENTNNAYIRADISQISPQVSGEITQVLVKDNQKVKKGELLATIDDKAFNIELARAKANEQSAIARKQNVEANLKRQDALLLVAEADLKAKQAELLFARQQQERYEKMAITGSGSREAAGKARTQAKTASANVTQAESNIKATKAMKNMLTAQLDESLSEIQLAQSQKEMAELNLSYTKINAPIDGVVDGKKVRIGEQVKAGEGLLSLVPQNELYIIANFQETQLEHVLPGLFVDIEIDTFSGKKLQGIVESIAPASGASFSLIKPENATGNFTKIVQRIPVKITFLPNNDQREVYSALRVGMSAEVSIKLKKDSK